LLVSYRFADSEQGSLVTLGFGLLLRECWRAIKAEKNDQDTPQLLRESCLREEMVGQVVKAIEGVMRQMPSEGRRHPGEKTATTRNLLLRPLFQRHLASSLAPRRAALPKGPQASGSALQPKKFLEMLTKNWRWLRPQYLSKVVKLVPMYISFRNSEAKSQVSIL
jgi:uncharacterized protein YbdZ (MbtH family)